METIREKTQELANKAVSAERSEDAMKFAQAALNLAHAFATLRGADQLK